MFTASMTTVPAATPMLSVSTTVTGKSSSSSATMRTVWQVAESPDEMLTKTADVYPSARAFSKVALMTSGEGSDVVGISLGRRATSSSGVIVTPLS